MTPRLLILALLVFCAVLPGASTAGASEPPPPFWSISGWGDNTWGQIDPATCCNPKPHPVNGPGGEWATIAAGERVSVGVRPDGTVWEWG